MDAKTKVCKSCGVEKELSYFHKNHKSHLGCLNECSTCFNERRRPERRKGLGGYDLERAELSRTAKKIGIGSGTLLRIPPEKAILVYFFSKFRCSICGTKEDLTVHHLDHKGRNKLDKGEPQNNRLDNLVVLCRKCHGTLHKKSILDEGSD